MGTAFSCSVLPSPPLPNSEFILAVTTHTHRATILPTAPTTVLADAGNFKPQPLSCGLPGPLDGFLGLLASRFPQQRCQPQRFPRRKRWACHVSGVILVSREKLEKRVNTHFSSKDHLRHYDPLAITNTPAIRNELDSKPRIGHQNTRRLGLLSLSVLLH